MQDQLGKEDTSETVQIGAYKDQSRSTHIHASRCQHLPLKVTCPWSLFRGTLLKMESRRSLFQPFLHSVLDSTHVISLIPWYLGTPLISVMQRPLIRVSRSSPRQKTGVLNDNFGPILSQVVLTETPTVQFRQTPWVLWQYPRRYKPSFSSRLNMLLVITLC